MAFALALEVVGSCYVASALRSAQHSGRGRILYAARAGLICALEIGVLAQAQQFPDDCGVELSVREGEPVALGQRASFAVRIARALAAQLHRVATIVEVVLTCIVEQVDAVEQEVSERVVALASLDGAHERLVELEVSADTGSTTWIGRSG